MLKLNPSEVIQCDFSEVEFIWSTQLWPGRQSKIEPTSAIDHEGDINLNILESKPVFLKIEENKKIVGVLSGFQTSQRLYRSRGLWVEPAHRRRGLASKLIAEIERRAVLAKCDTLWTMPRASAQAFYLQQGFKIYKAIAKYEFGPHLLVQKPIG